MQHGANVPTARAVRRFDSSTYRQLEVRRACAILAAMKKASPPSRSPWLTEPMERCLRQMSAEHEEMAWTGIHVWVGGTRYSASTARKLLQLCLIKSDSGGRDIYWQITPCGQAIIKDPAYEPAIVTSQRTGQPVLNRGETQ